MQVAVIGVGVMGSAIAGRLLDIGASVALFDRDHSKYTELVARGAYGASSACEAAERAEFIITSLNSAAIVEAAIFGAEGIASAAGPSKILFDMSSIDAGKTAEFATRLRQDFAMGWVDAPLSGGAPAAAQGCLTLMVGGEGADVERVRPLLDVLSNNYTHFGAPGAGQTVKLINQILCAANFMAIAEAVRFAEAFDVDATKIPAALAGGRADSRIMQEFMSKMARRDYSPTGRIDNMLKDLETAQGAAHSKRVPLPITSLITDLHRMLVAAGLGDADSAEYMELFDLATHRK